MSEKDRIQKREEYIDISTGDILDSKVSKVESPDTIYIKMPWSKVFPTLSILYYDPNLAGRLAILSQFLKRRTNLLWITEKNVKYDLSKQFPGRGGTRPLDKKDMESILYKSRRVIDDFVKLSIEKTLMAKKGTNQNPEFYLNPIYFLKGDRVDIETFLLFKDDPNIFRYVKNIPEEDLLVLNKYRDRKKNHPK